MSSQSVPKAGEGEVPQRKPLTQHKQSMTVSLKRDNREWIREHHEELGYRSESHAVDAAIDLLKEKSKEDKK